MLAAPLKKYDESNTAVRDTEAVQKAKAEFDSACKDYEAIKQRVAKLDRLCTPVLSSSNNHATPPGRLEVTRAQLALPQLRLQLVESELALEAARLTYEEAMAKAAQALTEARVARRKVLVSELFDVLDQAKQLADGIQEYDDETRELGGAAPQVPMAELVGDKFRPDIITFNAERLRAEGWL